MATPTMSPLFSNLTIFRSKLSMYTSISPEWSLNVNSLSLTILVILPAIFVKFLGFAITFLRL